MRKLNFDADKCRLGTSKVLVINTIKAATDLLEKKGAIYSGI